MIDLSQLSDKDLEALSKNDLASMSDAADNRYNQIFKNIIEEGAKELYDNPQFREGGLELRQNMVNNLLKSAKEATLSYMGRVAANSGDGTLLKMIEISGKDRLKVDRVIKSLGMDKELKDMSDDELDTVATALRFREDYLLKQ